MPNVLGRGILDANLTAVTAFPAAGATANSASLDLGPKYLQSERLEFGIVWPLVTPLADTKNLIFNVQTSPDNSTWTNAGITKTITGAGGIGTPAGEYLFRLASTAPQYVRVSVAEDAAGGVVTGLNFTLNAYF